MDVLLVLKAATWLILLTGFTVALSHILRRTDWLPSWFRGWWIRRNAEDPRREGWGWLFIFAGFALPILVQEFASADLYKTLWAAWTPYVASVTLIFVGALIQSWPQIRRFQHWVDAKRQRS